MSDGHDGSDSEDGAIDLFNEPEGYYEPEKPPTTESYTLQDGRELQLRLVGHNPLWGHLLWQAGLTISKYLESNAATLIHNRDVLELGAGAGLPSLVCALHGARQVVVTDYPDAALVSNLEHNISTNIPSTPGGRNIAAEGYVWGADTTALTAHLRSSGEGQQQKSAGTEKTFHLLILADLLFNHSEHGKLLDTVRRTLRRSEDAQALVFFTPYRPWLLEKDLAFFDLAQGKSSASQSDDANGQEGGNFVVSQILKHVMDQVMFEEDPGDEKLRRTVFGYSLRWKPELLRSQVEK